MNHPNILFLIPHDLGTFLGCYGHGAVSSPRLDELAAQGASCSQCFTTTAECSPSRGAIFTGRMPHANGLMGLANFGWSLRVPHLAARLRDAGYATHHFGFQHEIHGSVRELGYEHAHHDAGAEAPDVCADLCGFLQKRAAQPGRAPWFACAGFRHVHREWPRATRFSPAQVEVPPWLPDCEVVRRDLARFYQDIEELDAAVGAVLGTLARTGLDSDTLVLFTSDHGAAFPGAKATMYDPGLRIPLIMRLPGVVAGATVHPQLLSALDIAPTLLEVAGTEIPPELEGRSLLPLLGGEAWEEREEVPGALFYDVAYDPVHSLRTRRYKYIRSFAVPGVAAVAGAPAGAQGAWREVRSTFAAGRWIRVDDFDVLTSPTWQAVGDELGAQSPPAEELYDLRQDPWERRNLASSPTHTGVLREMRQRLQRMMRATASPLLAGHVQPPAAQVAAARNFGPSSPRFAQTASRRMSLLGTP